MLKKIASYGFRVYIDPHQDIVSGLKRVATVSQKLLNLTFPIPVA